MRENWRIKLANVAYPSTSDLAIVGSGDILGLVPAGHHTVTTNGPETPPCTCCWYPSRFPPVLELLLVTVGAKLVVLGVVPLVVHVGDGEIIWGLGGLDIGVVDSLM